MVEDIWDGKTPYIKGFWNWTPATWASIGFRDDYRNTLISKTTNPFIIVSYVTLTTQEAPKNIRGKIVGFYVVSHQKGHRNEFTAPEHHLRHPEKWQNAIRAIRAFSFLPEDCLDVYDFDPSIKNAAVPTAERGKLLSDEQVKILKSMPYREVPIYGGEHAALNVMDGTIYENAAISSGLSRITGKLIGELYYFAKEVYEGRASREDALYSVQAAPASASMYFEGFQQMRTGAAYQRTMNEEGTDYFLNQIHADYGAAGLKLALQSVEAHLRYYDGLGKGTQRAIRTLWEKYSSMLDDREGVAQDIEEIVSDTTVDATTRQTLIEARIGQGKFRHDVMLYWNKKCAISGCSTEAVLRASHIKPWRVCSNEERINPNNGLLLAANFDALFDRGLISFADDGRLLVSSSLADDEKELLDLRDRRLRAAPTARIKEYLAYHRKEFLFNS